jgi:GH15 family glucan-1,4-alpha-glucosidase
MYLDERFAPERGEAVFRLLERLATEAARVGGTPDAGIWEPRTAPRVETFSSLMCWTAMDRVSNIAASLKRPSAQPLRTAADALHARIVAEAWNEKAGAFASSFGGSMLDASLLQMPRMRFLPKDDPRLKATVDVIAKTLDHKGWLLRYLTDDGFGIPTVAFTLCTFWLVEALAATQRMDLARELLERLAKVASPVGLYSEDFDPVNVRLWGNFPQAYSHVGLIHAAFAASPTWAEVM